MKFGLMFANTGGYAHPDAAVDLARTAEEAGFESLWAVEHVVVPKGYGSRYPYNESGRMPGRLEDFDLPDPLVWLAFVASATRTINLATGILILPQRNPVVTAKAVASLDHLSGGRVVLGVGVGWLAEEFATLGVPFEDRGARTDDYIGALKALWTQELPSYEGRYVSFRDVYCRPRPVRGDVPVVVGGHTRRAARRAGELGDGFFPGRGTPQELAELFDVVRASASAAGRDPAAVELTAGAGRRVEGMRQLADLGVGRIIVPPSDLDGIKRFGDEVIARFDA